MKRRTHTYRVTPRFLPRGWSIGLEFAALLVLLADYCLQVLAEGRALIMCVHYVLKTGWHRHYKSLTGPHSHIHTRQLSPLAPRLLAPAPPRR